jgi:hypothetical protein
LTFTIYSGALNKAAGLGGDQHLTPSPEPLSME